MPVAITVITVPNNAVNIVMVDPVTTQTDFVPANLVILETDVTQVGLFFFSLIITLTFEQYTLFV